MDSINNEILWIFIGLFSFLIIASIIGAILAALSYPLRLNFMACIT